MRSTIKILITRNYLLQIKLIQNQTNETIIYLSDTNQEEYNTPSITFDGNFIKVCENTNNQIHFLQKWIENPDDYTEYIIQFQNKQFSLLPEVLFTIIVNEFKKKIEKEFIIENTIVEVPSSNQHIFERIKVSLESIDLKNITILTTPFDYTEQGDQLFELFERKESIEKHQRMIEKAKQSNPLEREKLNQIDLNQPNMNDEDHFNNQLSLKFTTKQRTEMKLCKLDNYCLFLSSMYFESIDDHVNLIQVTKKLKYNMEKFYYNPVSLNSITVNFFPNIETFHLYDSHDIYLKGNRISMFCDWNNISYFESISMEQDVQSPINFKRLTWTEKDTDLSVNLQINTNLINQNRRNNWFYRQRDVFIHIRIPEDVIELEENCFDKFKYDIIEITIPNSVKIIPKNCFEKVSLTSLHIPLLDNRFFQRNKIFTYPHMVELCSLPYTICQVNDEKIQRTTKTFEIPTFVTSVGENCFDGDDYLKKIIIPESVKYIHHDEFKKLPYLEDITIPSHFSFQGNKLFHIHNNCLYSVYLPMSLRFINNFKIQFKPLKTFTIPSCVTKLSDYCFAFCEELIEINGIENIKEFGNGCFIYCPFQLKIN